jgi:hypothetical protein
MTYLKCDFILRRLNMPEPIEKQVLVRTETGLIGEKEYRLEIFLGEKVGYTADFYRSNSDGWEIVERSITVHYPGNDHEKAAEIAWLLFVPD